MPHDAKTNANDNPRAGRWVLAALELAQGATAPIAAAAAGVSVPTLNRWKRIPRFQEKVDALRTQLLSQTVGQLVALHTAAVNALGGLLADPNSSVRLGAASKILTLTLAAREHLETSKKIERLETIAAAWEEKQAEAAGGRSRSSN